ncbi:hypothetical protein ACA910_015824 [Epithemia clementina (nom. ined.)]
MSAATASNKKEEDIDLSTVVAGVFFSSCLYNASGPRSGTVEALKKVAASANTGAVLSKSATLTSQTGNPLPRIHHDDVTGTSFNSEGLPNQGIDYYLDLDNIKQILGETNDNDNDDHSENQSTGGKKIKPYIVSLSGKTMEDNLVMLQRIASLSKDALARISAIELNLACPNIVGKPILAYDMEQLGDVLKRISQVFGSYLQSGSSSLQLPPLGVKLPPYLDMMQLQQVADILNQHSNILSFITTINTMGNALPIDLSVQQPYILANSGLAGMSGRALKAHALANVHQLRQSLASSIDIVGVGGIETGEDVIAMILAGAKAVQIGTVHWKEGPSCFDRIAQETRQWLRDHGYSSVSDIYNQLQPWSKERANQARLLRKEAEKVKQKNQQQQLQSTQKAPSTETSAQLWKLLSAILAVIVAALCADKWNTRCYPTSSE